MSYNIVIVGGGSAGWSAALGLSHLRDSSITVIEPEVNNAIGVGESTLPLINAFHNIYGINKKDFFNAVNATIKLTIEFSDFARKDHIWTHPFISGTGIEEHAINEIISDGLTDTQYNVFSDKLPLAKKRTEGFNDFDLMTSDALYQTPGYHIDSIKYGDFLKNETLKKDNVKLFTSAVQDVIIENDVIEKLVLEDGREIVADLFIDCTGFKKLLISKTSASWQSVSDRLYCDSSVAVQLPYLDVETQKVNTTRCFALSSGWVWTVPLQDRIGTGYVFSKRHQSYEDSLSEFKEYLANLGYNTSELTFREVPFDAGSWDETWKGNVIPIGLSSAFVEPLESTGIALFQKQVIDLVEVLGTFGIDYPYSKKIFNNQCKEAVQDVIDFVQMHYSLAERADTPFWADCKEMQFTPFQKHMFKSWIDSKEEFNNATIIKGLKRQTLFDYTSFASMFLGYGVQPNVI